MNYMCNYTKLSNLFMTKTRPRDYIYRHIGWLIKYRICEQVQSSNRFLYLIKRMCQRTDILLTLKNVIKDLNVWSIKILEIKSWRSMV